MGPVPLMSWSSTRLTASPVPWPTSPSSSSCSTPAVAAVMEDAARQEGGGVLLYSAGIRSTGVDGPMRKDRRFLATWTGTCPGSDTLLDNEKCTVSTTTNRYNIEPEFKTSQVESVRSRSIRNS
jgi:hypothetical protein